MFGDQLIASTQSVFCRDYKPVTTQVCGEYVILKRQVSKSIRVVENNQTSGQSVRVEFPLEISSSSEFSPLPPSRIIVVNFGIVGRF